ncbi:hypothetical protein M407DRAFT_159640 [Tulasnella calospora MUT 4182]|uniref:Uncharacterized protein n=1 Tax=Tulasnella calospora MUT 4182 TaxID=1051891 RepID=A0A0C3M8H6_9AGAM|nr:hypothetical protein M407DRAFT_159640 [Tulasnella calospora MUT 4182]
MDCATGQCDVPPAQSVVQKNEEITSVAAVEDVMNPLTFIPPPFAGVPSITVEFCDRCRWLHRATWVQTELFLTFPPPILRGITLLPLNSPETGGRFRVWLRWASPSSNSSSTQETTDAPSESAMIDSKTGDKDSVTNGDPVFANELLWDRKTEGGFPELKVLKQKIRDRLQPGVSLGHSDKSNAKKAEAGKAE